MLENIFTFFKKNLLVKGKIMESQQEQQKCKRSKRNIRALDNLQHP